MSNSVEPRDSVPPAAQPSNGNEESSTPISPNRWSFYSVAVVIAGLLVAVFLILNEYEAASDTTSVLAAVVPVFGVIGGAIFGVTVAYPAGRKSGEADGEKAGADQTKRAIGPILDEVTSRYDRLKTTLQSEMSSVPGEGVLRTYDEPDLRRPEWNVPHADLDDLTALLGELRGRLG